VSPPWDIQLMAELEQATELFREIAEKAGNNDNFALVGQLLYGLALR